MKVNTDFTKILSKDSEKQWVALSRDHSVLVGSSEKLADLRTALGSRRNSVVYMKVLPSDREFAF